MTTEEKQIDLSILDNIQKQFVLDIIPKINSILIKYDFVLIGGTGLALQIQHRKCDDFNFVCKKKFVTEDLRQHLSKQFSYLITHVDKFTISLLFEDRVKVSFSGNYSYKFIAPPVHFQNLKVASIDDILGTIIASITKRAEINDYFDMAYCLKELNYSIEDLLKFFRAKYPKDGPSIQDSLILTYLEDLDNLEESKIIINDKSSFWKGDLKKRIKSVMSSKMNDYIKKNVKE